MQTISRDRKFVISAPETAKTARRCEGLPREEDYDECVEVNIKLRQGCSSTLVDLINTIESDCFDWDCCGLQLLAKSLICTVTAGEKEYVFKIDRSQSFNEYLESLAEQLTL